MKNKKNTSGTLKIKDLTACALFAALICIISPFAIPIGTIPVTLSLFGVMLAPCILGTARGTLSVSIYILLGILGLPVFSAGNAGPFVLASLSGGYILSYPFVCITVGICERFAKKCHFFRKHAVICTILSCIVGLIICYLLGSAQYCAVGNVAFQKALPVCILPFLPFDIIKCILVGVISEKMRAVLSKTVFSKERPTKSATCDF